MTGESLPETPSWSEALRTLRLRANRPVDRILVPCLLEGLPRSGLRWRFGDARDRVSPSGHRDKATRSTVFSEHSADSMKGLWHARYCRNFNSSLMRGPRRAPREGSGLPGFRSLFRCVSATQRSPIHRDERPRAKLLSRRIRVTITRIEMIIRINLHYSKNIEEK